MSRIITEMATDSQDCGFGIILILCAVAGLITWFLSENVWIVLVVVFLIQHICRAIGRASVSIQHEKTARIRGSAWGG